LFHLTKPSAEDQARRHFTWALFPEERAGGHGQRVNVKSINLVN
jgi:hypothetical protein